MIQHYRLFKMLSQEKIDEDAMQEEAMRLKKNRMLIGSLFTMILK
jgi:hypothetical protein